MQATRSKSKTGPPGDPGDSLYRANEVMGVRYLRLLDGPLVPSSIRAELVG